MFWYRGHGRRSAWTAAALACVCAFTATAPAQEPTESDAANLKVEAYLERLGLSRLMVVTLEERLAALPKAKRQPVAERLSVAYVAMLRDAPTETERSRWEAKARALLNAVPEAESIELRISVNQAIYERAESLAERAALRLTDPAETADAAQSLRLLAPTFTDIGGRAHRRVEQLERIESTGEITDKARQELAEARRLRSLAYYFAGWSNTYLALLAGGGGGGGGGQGSGAEGYALEALKDFGWLLNSAGRPAAVDRMPTSLLQYEHIGRAAIGSALAASARGNDAEALRWLDVVQEAADTPASVKAQIPPRRMLILGRAKRWADLERLVRMQRRGEKGPRDVKPLPPAVARLLAIIALEADRKVAGEQIEALARTALGDLVAHREIAQVLDLVEKYGTAPLGDTGFIAMYVRGVQEYELARKAHAGAGDANEPTENAEAVTRYRSASRMLESAERQPDSAEFARERVRAALSRGLAAFYIGDFERAAEVLAAAWTLARQTPAVPAPEAEETLWTAVLAWNRAVDAAKDSGATAAKRDQAVALFLKTYPESANAPRLILMRTATGQLNDDEALKALSGVGRESPVYEAAQRQMARILYTRFRSPLTAAPARDRAAAQFLEVAEGLFEADAKAAMDPDGKERLAAAERAIARARQMLDVLLAGSAPDADRAESVLKRLRSVALVASVDLGQHEAELLLRDAQIALARDKEAEAIEAADRLFALNVPPQGGQYGAAAERLVYRRLAQRWSAATDDNADKTGLDLIRIGVRIIDRAGADSSVLRDAGIIALQHTVASAATLRFKRTGDAGMRDLAIRLDKSLLAFEPGSEPSLRRLAENSESAGEVGTAVECWRVLLDGAPSGDPPWFEAKYHMLRLLATSDPERVRAALGQHVALYPEYGPDPWGAKFRELEASLGGPLAPPEPTAPPAPADGGAAGSGRTERESGGTP